MARASPAPSTTRARFPPCAEAVDGAGFPRAEHDEGAFPALRRGSRWRGP